MVMELEWIGELLREAKQSVLLQLERRGKEDKDMSLLCLPLALACHWKFALPIAMMGAGLGHACMGLVSLSLSLSNKRLFVQTFFVVCPEIISLSFLVPGPSDADEQSFYSQHKPYPVVSCSLLPGQVGKTLRTLVY